MTSTQPVIVYTDGGCIGNPGPGGWAAVLVYGEHRKELSGRYWQTTNNRMELRAAIHALDALKRPCPVELFTDSQYVRDGITRWVQGWQRNGWRTASKKPVKNRDLWLLLLAAVERHRSVGGVSWHWTKGHAGDELNELADDLANRAAQSATMSDPIDEEPPAATLFLDEV
ncbi:MAG: ribonuclease HI [Caldilineaceae bacterium]|nr:ribonuclease HI [Caldilineaceae bacterium]